MNQSTEIKNYAVEAQNSMGGDPAYCSDHSEIQLDEDGRCAVCHDMRGCMVACEDCIFEYSDRCFSTDPEAGYCDEGIKSDDLYKVVNMEKEITELKTALKAKTKELEFATRTTFNSGYYRFLIEIEFDSRETSREMAVLMIQSMIEDGFYNDPNKSLWAYDFEGSRNGQIVRKPAPLPTVGDKCLNCKKGKSTPFYCKVVDGEMGQEDWCYGHKRK